MVLNGARDSHTPMFDKVSLFVIPAVIVLAGLVGFALVRSPIAFDAATIRGSVAITSKTLFDVAQSGPGYFVLFEVLGVLLLSAMGAAVLLAKKRLGSVESEKTEDKH
jgi:NADH-quinone oxidoreductase subunit J